MNYRLRIAGKDIAVEAEFREEGILSAVIDGRRLTARYRIIPDNRIHLEVDGSCINTYLAGSPDGKLINAEGISYLVQDADAMAKSIIRKRGLKELPQVVTPPMPSVVVRIMVSAGDRVEKGQSIIVVSAMKMEATLQAPFAGRVQNINTAEGEKVMPGQILVDIEREDQE